MTKISRNLEEQRRERVYKFYFENKSKGKMFTVNHFLNERISKRTIYSIIGRAEKNIDFKRRPGSGRRPKIMTKKKIELLIKTFDHQDGISQRQAARKFNCSQSHISKTLKTHTKIEKRKKTTIPKRSEKQIDNARKRCGRLYRNFSNLDFILDDESYFTLTHGNINGNDIFYTSNINLTKPEVKYKKKAKFEEKLLVWMCMSNKGFSKVFFVNSGLAINQDVYLNECIKKRLIPFICKYHQDNNYVFWPDLASSHYAKKVIEYLDHRNINYVPKEDNPPNVPECRPIENFWSILKGKVYQKNWQAKTIDQLKKRIKFCLKKIDKSLVQRLFDSIKLRLGKIRRNGVIEVS